jgi:NAD(P)H-hydrate epimerase
VKDLSWLESLASETPVLTAEQTRALERSILGSGTPLEELISRAGANVSRETLRARPAVSRVLAIVGVGNNGRDALEAAVRLRQHGKRVMVAILPDARRSGAALSQEPLNVAERVVDASSEEGFRRIEQFRADVVIDGLYGIGFRSPLPDVAARVLAFVNELPAFRVAIDIPSGVEPDTGNADPCAFCADVTVTFFALKPCHVLLPGRTHSGSVRCGSLGFARFVNEYAARLREKGDRTIVVPPLRALREYMPRRLPTAHKKTSRVLVVAGSLSMPGAAALCALGAFAAGAGYVAVASVADARQVVLSRVPEAVFIELPARDGALTLECAQTLTEISSDYNAAVVGPGLSRTEEVCALVRSLYETLPLPAVFDGDALFALSRGEPAQVSRGFARIITPHVGEARNLLSTAEGEGEPPRAQSLDIVRTSERLAELFQAVCVLKSSSTIVAGPRGEKDFLLPYGTSVLATAGTGDVLAGVLSAFLAAGMTAEKAAVGGVLVQQAAARNATEALNGRPLRATELVPFVSNVLEGLCESERGW